MGRGRVKFGSDSFEIVGFLLGDLVAGDDFARQGIPKEDFAAVGSGAEAFAAGNEFFYPDHISIIAENML